MHASSVLFDCSVRKWICARLCLPKDLWWWPRSLAPAETWVGQVHGMLKHYSVQEKASDCTYWILGRYYIICCLDSRRLFRFYLILKMNLACMLGIGTYPQKGLFVGTFSALPFPCIFQTQPSAVFTEQPICFVRKRNHWCLLPCFWKCWWWVQGCHHHLLSFPP